MATAIVHAFRPTRSRVLTLVTILAILFGCYGLLSAQQARSAPTLAKQVWGGIEANGAITHQKHITSVVRVGTGQYRITFDRHVDNCSIQLTARYEGDSVGYNQFAIGAAGLPSNQILVLETNAAASAQRDGDFDVFGMCPST